ncbi:neuropeptide FF receptor 2-like [Anneissia japonica]|uniref:neuropeptide FF receptor 2-like n=1 Tax=Anneissia japonica TaxID=1529436 RepID=UPI0014256B29|nr:neuropeptide FF receptor 2-like [Anneissia japonica]
MESRNCTTVHHLNRNNTTGVVFFVIYVIVTTTIAVFGNLLVSAAIFWKREIKEGKPMKERKLPKTRNILILNLSLVDILMGIILTIWIILQDITTCMLTFSLCFTSTSIHLAIALDRFYRIFYFPRNVDLNTERRTLYAISVALWIVPMTMFVTLLLVDRDVYRVVTYTLSPIISLVVVNATAVLYTLIFRKVRKHEENMTAALGRKKFEKTKLILKAYVGLVIADAVCWLPWIVESLHIYSSQYAGLPEEERCLETTTVYFFAFCLGLLNASTNAIIYWKTLPDINKGVAQIIRTIISCCRSIHDDA